MLRAVPMVFLRVQVANKDAAEVTRCIAREGVLHLVDLAHGRVPATETTGITELLAGYRDLDRRLRKTADRLRLRAPSLVGKLEGHAAPPASELEALEARVKPTERTVDDGWEALVAAREAVTHAQEGLERAQVLTDAGIDVRRVLELRFTHLRLFRATDESASRAGSMMDPSPFAFVPLSREGDRGTWAAGVPAQSQERLEQVLRLAGCEPLAVPESADEWDTTALEQKLAEAEAHVAEIERRMAELRREFEPLLAECVPRVQTAAMLLQAQTHFANAGRFVVISGWVPASYVHRLELEIAKATAGRAVIDVYRPDAVGDVASGLLKVPILHRNPILLRPFHRLVEVYGTPSYEEVEPTAFFAMSFLLMFGLMFGDVGHGAILFAGGWFIFRYMARYLDYGLLLMEGGAVSMFFGVLYGSVFGMEWILPSLWLHPMRDLTKFMATAVVIGIVILTIGIALNIVNGWRAGQRAQALFGVRGLFGGVVYWITLVLLAQLLLPRMKLPGWVLGALAGLAVLLLALRPLIVRRLSARAPRVRPQDRGPWWLGALEGGIELVDTVFGFFTNTLSFVRIAAFAAVHAGILIALFGVVDTLSETRFGGPLTVVTLVLGNALIILLEGLTVSVQTLRLEYYEFFSRFFRGGGEPYEPLSLEPSPEKGVPHERPNPESEEAGHRRTRPRPLRPRHPVRTGLR